MKTTHEHWADDLADRLEDAQAEAEHWRRFAGVSLIINFALAAWGAFGWFM